MNITHMQWKITHTVPYHIKKSLRTKKNITHRPIFRCITHNTYLTILFQKKVHNTYNSYAFILSLCVILTKFFQVSSLF